jgi:hypothetical protein
LLCQFFSALLSVIVSLKSTSTSTRKLTAEEVRAAVGMEIDDEVIETDDGISEVLAQREEEVMGPSAGADDSPKGGRKQANKKGLAPLENTVTKGLITAAEAKRRARREKRLRRHKFKPPCAFFTAFAKTPLAHFLHSRRQEERSSTAVSTL